MSSRSTETFPDQLVYPFEGDYAPNPMFDEIALTIEAMRAKWADAADYARDRVGIKINPSIEDLQLHFAVHAYSAQLLKGFVSAESKQQITDAFTSTITRAMYLTGEVNTSDLTEEAALHSPSKTMRGLAFAYPNLFNITHSKFGKASADDLELMADALNATPLKLGNRFTKDRRATDHLKQWLSDMPSEGLLTSQSANLAHTLAFFDSLYKLELSGDALAELQHQARTNPVIRSRDIQRAYRAQRQSERQLVTSLLETGTLDYRSTHEHYEGTSRLLAGVLVHDMPQKLRTELSQELDTSTRDYTQTIGRFETFMMLKKGHFHKLMFEIEVEAGTAIRAARHYILRAMQPDLVEAPVIEQTQYTPKQTEHDPEAEQMAAEELKQLTEQHEALSDQLGELRKPYTASMKTVRSAGLNALLHDLQQGLLLPDEGINMNGITRGQSQQVSQFLYGLMGERSQAQDAATFRMNTAHDLATEQDLVHSLRTIREQLYARGVNGFEMLDTDLYNTYDWIGTNKAAVQSLISQHLPPAEANRYNILLDELLTMPTEVVPDESIAEAEITHEEEVLDEPEDPTPPVEFMAEANPQPEPGLPLSAKEEAYQLDWEVFPADASLKTVREATERSYTSAVTTKIDWSRIKDLIELRDTFGGTLYRAKPRTLGSKEPYFVVELKIDSKTFAVADHPMYKNATYILREDLAYGTETWQEAFSHPRNVAREVIGAEKIDHRGNTRHQDRILARLQSLQLVKRV